MRTVTATDIRGLGETQTLEFKRALAHRNQGLQSLCGMVNANGASGTVIFGVDPSGAIVGVEDGNLDTAQRSLAQHIGDKFEPALMAQIEVVACEGKPLIVVQAQRPKTVPYHEYDGRALIREGSVTRPLRLEEKRRLTRQRDRDQHVMGWKCDGCGAVMLGMLNADIITIGPNNTFHRERAYGCRRCGGEYWPLE